MATVQTTTITLTNSTGMHGFFYLARRADSNLGLKAIPVTGGLANTWSFPRSTVYQIGVFQNQTRQFSIQSETGTDAVMDYWYIAFFDLGGRNLYELDGSGSMLMPQSALKIGTNTGFSFSGTGPYNIGMSSDYGGGHQSGMSLVPPVPSTPYQMLPTVRTNLESLTSGPLRTAFVNALKALKQVPSRLIPQTNSRYDDYVLIHMLAMNEITVKNANLRIDNSNITITGPRDEMWAHEKPLFLPWHRVFIREFEKDLQLAGLGRGAGLPYWDWTVDNTTTGIPWQVDLMGSGTPEGPVQSGPFAGSSGFQVTLSEPVTGPPALIRGLGAIQPGFNLPVSADVQATLAKGRYSMKPWNKSETNESFSNGTEGFYSASGSPLPAMHNRVHNWVGGVIEQGGQMLFSSSPNDPTFYIHHTNIDRLWVLWQQQHTDKTFPFAPQVPFYEPVNPIPGMPGIGIDEDMIFMDAGVASQPWSTTRTPGDVVQHYDLNYCYDFELPPGFGYSFQQSIEAIEEEARSMGKEELVLAEC